MFGLKRTPCDDTTRLMERQKEVVLFQNKNIAAMRRTIERHEATITNLKEQIEASGMAARNEIAKAVSDANDTILRQQEIILSQDIRNHNARLAARLETHNVI